MIFTAENFKSLFDSSLTQQSIPPQYMQSMEEQVILMYNDCFGESINVREYDMKLIIDAEYNDVTDTVQVRGFLNYAEVPNTDKAEIYNVCVHPSFRRKGILGGLLSALPKDKYYYLLVLFTNKKAYLSYLKYFFCDFVAIGRLYKSGLGFILGGRPWTNCDSKRNQIANVLDSVAAQIEFLESHQQPFEELYNHFVTHFDTYSFIYQYWDLVFQIVTLQSDMIKLSDEIISALNFTRVFTSEGTPLNVFTMENRKEILELMINSRSYYA